jgi:dihydroorotate dehydrogenase (NAD+) catalytic subunit
MAPTSTLRPEDVDVSTSIADLQLENPIMTASGCAAAGRELQQFFDVAELGAVVTKSIMRDPRSGRPTPRMAETASGMLNSIGLQGPGVDAFLARDLPWLLQHDARPVVSIAGSSMAEYAELARRVGNSPGVAAIEVNISCPNVENRGLVFACDPFQAARVVAAAAYRCWPSCRPT